MRTRTFLVAEGVDEMTLKPMRVHRFRVQPSRWSRSGQLNRKRNIGIMADSHGETRKKIILKVWPFPEKAIIK